jgi:hypothetical protein
MKQTKYLATILVFLCSAFIITSCKKTDDNPSSVIVSQYIPQAPDYLDAAMWITEDGDPEGIGADIFYVVSTWEEDWTTEDGRICHYADVYNPEHRKHMADKEIKKVAA